MRAHGKKSIIKDADKKVAKTMFFVARGELVEDELRAYCQSCGRPLGMRSCDFSHKVPAGQGGDIKARVQPENGIASCRPCHQWLEIGPMAIEARQFLIDSPANLVNGERVLWPQKLLESLHEWLRKHPSY